MLKIGAHPMSCPSSLTLAQYVASLSSPYSSIHQTRTGKKDIFPAMRIILFSQNTQIWYQIGPQGPIMCVNEFVKEWLERFSLVGKHPSNPTLQIVMHCPRQVSFKPLRPFHLKMTSKTLAFSITCFRLSIYIYRLLFRRYIITNGLHHLH